MRKRPSSPFVCECGAVSSPLPYCAICRTHLSFEECCDHCGCPEGERFGHDDTCRLGCNDGLRKGSYPKEGGE